MIGTPASKAFAADNRGVSAVVGFILVFGILMLLLTIYQAQIVPQQNAQTEFEHFEETRDELVEMRNSISTAGQNDMSQFPSVTLGTTYQSRLLTVNPTPPAGTLQTSDAYNITISNGTAEHDLNISTRFLEYQPGYNEIAIGTTQYEHSVLYLDERDRGNNVSIIEDQNLLKDGTVRITALQNQFQQTGTNRVTLELYPQDEGDASAFPDPEGKPLNVSIPTQLDDDEYWDDALEDAGEMYVGVDTEAYPDDDDTYALNLSVDVEDDDEDLEVNTVGIQLEPDEDPAKNTDTESESESESETGSFSGTVLDDAGDPVDEEVTFTDENGNTLGAETPDPGDGSYEIEDVEVGEYDITASAVGFEDDEFDNVEIADGEETEDVDFTLDELEQAVESVDLEFDEEEVAEGEGNENDLTVTVEDENGDPAEAKDVTLSVEQGEGSLDETTVTTDGNGDATTTYTQDADDTAGDEIEVEATADGETDTATYDVVGGFEFTQLDVTNIETTQQGNPDDITIQYELSSEADVTFFAEEDAGDTDEVTETATTGGTVTLEIGGGGNNDFPVELEADISGGECLETTVEDEDDTKSLADWNECTT